MEYPIINWKKENLDQDLRELTLYAMDYARQFRDYYRNSANYKRSWAKILRIIAIISTALGGLLPVLSQILAKDDINLEPAWATVAITIAVTAIGLDRFFGFSSAWMRFITTEIKINSKIEQIKLNIENERFSWQGAAPDFDGAKTMINHITLFINEVSQIVKDETNTWMMEFQNSIQKFNEEANVKADNLKLGGVAVNIENAAEFSKGIKLQLESQEPIRFSGSSYSFNNLLPKIYKLVITGILEQTAEGVTAEKEIRNETLVNVTPGNITAVNINLK